MRAIVSALLLVGVFGSQCPPGYKHSSDLTGKICATNAEDAASCGACCEKNKLTCGGLAADGKVNCAWNEYAAGDDAWKNKAATAKTVNTDCCQPKVSCANQYFKMPAGKKTKDNVAALKCSSDAKSCTEGTTCLEDDLHTCGGFARAGNAGAAVTCGQSTGNSARDAPKGTGDPWLGQRSVNGLVFGTSVTTDTRFDTECCAPHLTCGASNIQCKDTTKIVTVGSPSPPCTATATQTGGTANSAVLADCGREPSPSPSPAPCCTSASTSYNPLTCGGHLDGTPTLCTAAGKVDGARSTSNDGEAAYTAWRKRTCTSATNCAAVCCVNRATCTQGTCKAGEKKIPNLPSTTTCGANTLGNIASCAGTQCCTKDTNTCGGLSTGIGNVVDCKWGTFDERITWNDKTPQAVKDAWNSKPANSTNVNTNCCTAVAVCKVPTGTTTPSVVVVNVQVPSLKYSQHKIATADRPVGTQMLWLGVGGLVGMTVLMAVQFLRSRQAAAQDQSPEDDSLLGAQ